MHTIIVTPNGFLANKCTGVLEQYVQGLTEITRDFATALHFLRKNRVILVGLVIDMVPFRSKESAALEALLREAHTRNTHAHVYYLISQRKEGCLATIRSLHQYPPLSTLTRHELSGMTLFDWEAGLAAGIAKDELPCKPCYPPPLKRPLSL